MKPMHTPEAVTAIDGCCVAEKTPELSLEQRQKIADWLQARGVPKPCTSCGSSQWSLASHLVTPVLMQGLSVTLGGTSYPQAMLICGHCGRTDYFNVLKMGILKPEGKDGSS